MINKYDYRELRELINANHDRFSELNFDNSLSTLQKMNALVELLKVLLKEFNSIVEYLEQFQEKFDEKLYTTVEEILQKWKDDGVFDDIVNDIILDGVTHRLYYFNTVAEMKAYQKLKLGDSVKTTGFNSQGDGGGALYKIIAKTDDFEIDEGGYISLANGLVANIIVENGTIDIAQFGASRSMGNNAGPIAQKVIDYIEKHKVLSNYDMTLFLSGKHRFASGITISGGRISVRGNGFGSIMNCDANIPYAIRYNVPEGTSTTGTLRDFMIINPAVCVTSTRASVDLSISGVWFGQSGKHIDGSFVSVDISNCFLEMAKQGSINTQTATGFRKFVISNNIFYGNNGFHINMVGDPNYTRITNGIISGNSFDQAIEPLVAGNGGVRLAFARDIAITGNNINGEGGLYNTNMFSLISCKHITFSANIAHHSNAGILSMSSCEHIFLDIMAHDTVGGVVISDSKFINGKIMVQGVDGVGIYLNRVTDSQLSLIAHNCVQTGIQIYNSTDNIFNQITAIGNNTRNDFLFGGLVVSDETNPTSRNIFKDCIIYGNLRQNLLVNKGTTNTVFKDISFKTDSLELFVDLAQDESNIFQNVRTFG